MNIFVLDENPITAARMMCDKHIPKMVVESAQMMASVVRRWGATDEQMPLTKAGKPYKGGYANHPCTLWAGDSFGNFSWLHDHACALLSQYTTRFGKAHACAEPIAQLWHISPYLGSTGVAKTPFALAMPDEHRPIACHIKEGYLHHATAPEAVKAYRSYYHSKTFAKWEKGIPAPDWWQGAEVAA
jgi:hypothetical protein